MNLAIVAVLLTLGSPRMSFWGGSSVAIPEGCSGPAMLRMDVDWFHGAITCPGAQLTIAVSGGMVEPGCPTSAIASVHWSRLRTPAGQDVRLCHTRAAVERSQGDALAADIGWVHFKADVKSALGASLFLEVVASYQAGGTR